MPSDKLTDAAIKAAKPGPAPRKLSDGRGLYLEVAPTGSKWWRIKFRVGGRERRLSLGVYPDVSLALARQRRDALRAQVAAGIDPSAVRRAEKLARADTFEAVGREWLEKQTGRLSPGYREKLRARLEKELFPRLGRTPIADIRAPELLAALRRVESRGALEAAHRSLQDAGRVFAFAIATGRAERNPAADLRGALTPRRERHHASIKDPGGVGALLRAVRGYEGGPVVRAALALAPLVFVRPGELRHAEWAEIELDGEAPTWRIPAGKMKMRVDHVVPLARQAVAILRELHPLTGRGRYVFPSARGAARPMSDVALTAALRRIGYGVGEMTAHGFRSSASTLLHELGYPTDWVERQLAHQRTGVRGVYNYAEHLPERRRMLQEWADYLDRLADAGG